MREEEEILEGLYTNRCGRCHTFHPEDISCRDAKSWRKRREENRR